MKTRNIRYGTTLMTLVWLAAASSVHANDQPAGRFVMTVYENKAQGRAILEGSPQAIIDRVAKENGDAGLSFEENVNLCVALTQVKRVADATQACDAAVHASHKEARRIKRMASPAFVPSGETKDVIVLALTNRGVLHAITGEHDKARELFEEALDLQTRRSNAQLRANAAGNLALLEMDVAAAR